MQSLNEERETGAPENLVRSLTTRLRNQVLWDALLISVPPLLVAIYVIGFLYRAAWINAPTFIMSALFAAGIALLVVFLRCRPRIPSLLSAARLADQRAGAKDHFLTLVTLEPSPATAQLTARLRWQVAGFLPRVDLQRDFRYRIKRSFYGSLLVSLVTILVFHLLLPAAYSTLKSEVAARRLGELAAQMAQRPGLSGIARELQRLAVKIEDPKASEQERRTLIQEMRKKVEEQLNKEEEKENRNLLSQAASTLQGVEQQAAAGQEQQKEQEKGGGGIQSPSPQDGRGEGKSKAGGGGDGRGERTAEMNRDMQEGKSAQADPAEQGREKNPQKPGDGKNNKPDPNKPGRDQSKENSGQKQGGSDDKGGRGKSSEEIPQGAPPAERFYPAGGQGKEGLKGAGYVTVQLPEEVAADAKGQRSGAKDAKGNKVGASVPISNLPLPARVPDAPTEKQQLPLEYRGIIR